MWAGQLFLVFIEVYLNGEQNEKCSSEVNPVKRLCFSSMLHEDELTISVCDDFDNTISSQKRIKNVVKRFTINIRKNSLYNLLLNTSKPFMDRFRKYNYCFQMTSFGAKQIIKDGFMPTFKVKGQMYHLIGSLQALPQD